ncbi:ORF3 [torque teno Delphinidae virus 6]
MGSQSKRRYSTLTAQSAEEETCKPRNQKRIRRAAKRGKYCPKDGDERARRSLLAQEDKWSPLDSRPVPPLGPRNAYRAREFGVLSPRETNQAATATGASPASAAAAPPTRTTETITNVTVPLSKLYQSLINDLPPALPQSKLPPITAFSFKL